MSLEHEIAAALGARVRSLVRVHGGDVSEAFRASLDDGRDVFVKTMQGERAMLEAEAHGLGWLAEAKALRTPAVLAVTDHALVLEWVAPGHATTRGEEALGRGLAAMHRASPIHFGLDRPGWLAGIAWDNTPSHAWPTFYAERRLLPLFARVEARGGATTTMKRGIESVVRRIDALTGPAEPPARLHGDLWGGNAIWDAHGAPVLVDPAVYGGHREIDLAMMQLFGGFSTRTFAAYDEAWPRARGHEDRVPLYQLLPLLAHVVLFGGSYVASVERALRRLI